MLAPDRLVDWLRQNAKADKYGNKYFYHSRSDAHSIALCKFVLEDLLERSVVLRDQARKGEIVYGINYTFKGPQKQKALDLAIGPPVLHEINPDRTLAVENPKLSELDTPFLDLIKRGQLADLYLSCEAKAVMTEHGKSKPRIYDELSSSHEIVHQANPNALAIGITMVNAATRFVSPLRNKQPGITEVTQHTQPAAAAGMVNHLRGLPIRDAVGQVGFDAYCTFTVDLDNQTLPSAWTNSPAPQPGDRDHYETFLDRIVQLYAERYSPISK